MKTRATGVHLAAQNTVIVLGALARGLLELLLYAAVKYATRRRQ